MEYCVYQRSNLTTFYKYWNNSYVVVDSELKIYRNDRLHLLIDLKHGQFSVGGVRKKSYVKVGDLWKFNLYERDDDNKNDIIYILLMLASESEDVITNLRNRIIEQGIPVNEKRKRSILF